MNSYLQPFFWQSVPLFVIMTAILFTAGWFWKRAIARRSETRRYRGKFVFWWMFTGWCIGWSLWPLVGARFSDETIGCSFFGLLVGLVIGTIHGMLAVALRGNRRGASASYGQNLAMNKLIVDQRNPLSASPIRTSPPTDPAAGNDTVTEGWKFRHATGHVLTQFQCSECDWHQLIATPAERAVVRCPWCGWDDLDTARGGAFATLRCPVHGQVACLILEDDSLVNDGGELCCPHCLPPSEGIGSEGRLS